MRNSVSNEHMTNMTISACKPSIANFPQQHFYSSLGQLYRPKYVQNGTISQWHPIAPLSNSPQTKEHTSQQIVAMSKAVNNPVSGLDEILTSQDYDDHIFSDFYSHTNSPDTGPCTIDMQVLSFSSGSTGSASSIILTPLTPSTGPSSVDTNAVSNIDRLHTVLDKPSTHSTIDHGYIVKNINERFNFQASDLHLLNTKGPPTTENYKWGMKLNFLAVAKLSLSTMPSTNQPVAAATHHIAWLIEGHSNLESEKNLNGFDGTINRVDKLFIERGRSCELCIHLQPIFNSLQSINDFQKGGLYIRLEPFSMTSDDFNTRLPLRGSNKQNLGVGKSTVSTGSICFVNCWQHGCEYLELENGFVICRIPLKRTQETLTLTFPYLNSKCESAWKRHVFLDCVLVAQETGEVLAPTVRYQIYCCSSPARDAQRMFAKMIRTVPSRNAPLSTNLDSSLFRKRELSSWPGAEENGSPSKIQKLNPLSSEQNIPGGCLDKISQPEKLLSSSVTENVLSKDNKDMQSFTTNETPQYAVLTSNLAVWKILNGLKCQLEQLLNTKDDSIPS